MGKKAILREINGRLAKGENIISYLTNGHAVETSVEDEMISYDLRAGEDLERYGRDPGFSDRIIEKISSYIKETGCVSGTIVECGSGEGLNLTGILGGDGLSFSWGRGIDISWSRNFFARRHMRKTLGVENGGVDLDYIVGDMFRLPLKSSSVDMVYTMQGIYGMGGSEEKLLSELYRVTRKYLILIEPSYELADDEARERMDRLGYVKNLPGIAKNMGMEILKHELFGLDSNPRNPAAVIVIKKDETNEISVPICCPITNTDLEVVGNAYYSKDALISYPIINGIACLTEDYAVVTSKMGEYKNDTR